MNNKKRVLIIGLVTVNLSACVQTQDNLPPGYQMYAYEQIQLNPMDNYQRQVNYDYEPLKQKRQNVAVPDSYHVGEYHSPVSFKDRDKSWVSSQSPQAYTIEVAEDEKAAKVAGKLNKAPKSERMAQVKYQSSGKEYYKGLYGTYDSQDAAQKALDALPPDVKEGAGIKKWSSIQDNLAE